MYRKVLSHPKLTKFLEERMNDPSENEAVRNFAANLHNRLLAGEFYPDR